MTHSGRADVEPIVETLDLTRQVNGKRLVDGVSVRICPQDVTAVVGPSGAGKSSFLRLLNRLDEPTGGTVLFHGEDYREMPPRELRRRLGMVMQRPFLFPGTVAENIRFGPGQRGETVSDERIRSLLERVRLGGYAERDVARLSGGEAQRVSLARTLANDPEILLLDEPTSALDEATRDEVETLILEILAAGGLTCVMVTHDMDQARRMAQRAIVLREGRLEAEGLVEEVLNA